MPEHKEENLEKKPVFIIYPNTLNLMKKGICPTCGKKITEFRDSLSKKEYEITGVCQECQDRISMLSQA